MRIRHLAILLVVLLGCAAAFAANPFVEVVNPGSGPIGTQVTISGSGFGATQGASTVSVNNTGATVTSWSDSQIVFTVSSAISTGPVKVTVGGVASNTNMYFSIPAPHVTSITPNSGVVGTQVTIAGSGFHDTRGNGYATINTYLTITSWSDTQIVGTVATAALTAPVVVYNGSATSNQDVRFNMPNPLVSALSPATGPVGTQFQITGSGFGSTQGTSTVLIGTVAPSIVSWSDSQIVATVPTTAATGAVKVTVGGVASNTNFSFSVPAPRVVSVTPANGIVGSQVTIVGSSFQAVKGSSSVSLGGSAPTIVSWSDTQIVATVTSGARTGPVLVTVNFVASNQDVRFTLPNPVVTGVSPGSALRGAQVQISGSGFGATQGANTITMNNTVASVVSWSDTQVVATIPSTTTGPVRITAGGVLSNSDVYLTVLPPKISGISPDNGIVGTQITINGTGFQATKGSSAAYVNGYLATTSTWSDTQIVATVPANATTGPVWLNVTGINSNQDVVFTMPKPSLSSLSPASGSVGSQLQLNGSGFGATQGTSTVSFNGIAATAISSWSDTQIMATVPASAATGPIKVVVGGVPSNTQNFVIGNFVVNSVSPLAGPIATQVAVNGFGFGATQGTSTLSFNNTAATVSTWSDTQLIATIPSGATTGVVKVVKGGATSNTDVTFSVNAVAVSSINPASGPVGTQVQINGSGFGGTQGTSSVAFNNQAASIVSWSSTQIVATVPSAATTGAVKVTVGGVVSNTNVSFVVPVPQITSVSPTSGVVGTQVTINGTGFQATKGSSSVLFSPYTATTSSWSDTQIVATVPAGATSGPVKVFVNGIPSNQDVIFTMPKPQVTALLPASGPVGTQVQINGAGFGATQGSSAVAFNSQPAASIISWSDSQIVATVPSAAYSGPVKITVGGVASNADVYFTVPTSRITSITPTSGVVGTQVTVNGSGFQAVKGSSTLTFNGSSSTIVSWSDTQIVATVSSTVATTGPVVATVNGFYSNNDVIFTMPQPYVSGLTPSVGPAGAQVQINGSGFGASQGTSTVTFYNQPAASVVSWSDTQIVATVPSTFTTGYIKITVGGVSSNTDRYFTVPAPHVDSISPATGVIGTQVTINGSGFQATKGGSTVAFTGGSIVSIVSWSDTQIVATVPYGARTGPVVVWVNNTYASNSDVIFNLPKPYISTLTPGSGAAGTAVTVSGSGFGASQGSSTITFNGAAAAVSNWSDTQIIAAVPLALSNGGPVKVNVGGVDSNGDKYFSAPPPKITSVSPLVAGIGNVITITGERFHSTQCYLSCYVNFSPGYSGTILSWSDTQIVSTVPAGSVTGPLTVSVSAVASNAVAYTVPNHKVNSVSPTSGPVGTQITVTGVGFGATQGTSALNINSALVTAISSWSDTQIVATVPVTASTGPVMVSMNGAPSNLTVSYTVPPPVVTTFSPNHGGTGTQVTVTGSGFQANQRDSTLKFNGTPASVTSWSDTQIVATVPAGASTGPLTVAINTISSNTDKQFVVPQPVVSSLYPAAAAVGGLIEINGSGFGSSNLGGASHILFNGVYASFYSWTDTKILAYVPTGATTGNVTVTLYETASNAANLTLLDPPTITAVTPGSATTGSTIVITGTGFGPTQASSTLKFSSPLTQPLTYDNPEFLATLLATPTSWSNTQIVATVPTGASTGPITVEVAKLRGQSSPFLISSGIVQLLDSAGNLSTYNGVMVGGQWLVSDLTGPGCSSCSVRGTLQRSYDFSGNMLSSTDALSRTVTSTYDTADNLASRARQLNGGNVTDSYTYNSFGQVLTSTDALGHTTTNTYDTKGNLTSVMTPSPTTGVAGSVTTFAYDTKGQLTQITDPLNHITTMTYTAAGLVETITDAQNHVTSYEYDLRGNRTAVVDAVQHRTQFAYDAGNRLTSITYPGGTSTSFAYDGRGRRTSVTDQNGKVTAYGYDDADRLVSVTDAGSNVTQYAYDNENNLTNITDANGHTTSFTYDASRRLTQTAFPSSYAETYDYDAVGRLTSKTDRKGQTIQYVYDALNRLTHKGYPDSTGVDYVYDLVGKIQQVNDPTGTYGLVYDNMGRLVGTSTQYSFLPGTPFAVTYNYDAASNRTGMVDPQNNPTSYLYDTLNRLQTLTSPAGSFGFSYDALGRRTQMTRPNGVNSNYSYDNLSRLLTVLHQAGIATLDGATYTYDNIGNRLTRRDNRTSVSTNYSYDDIYRLTSATGGSNESYTYDPVGNRLTSATVPNYSLNSSNQLTSTSNATYIYDNNGNTLTKTDSSGTTTYNWDFENRLTAVVLPGSGGVVTFKYDPFGRRIQKTSGNGTTSYVYEGIDTLEEVNTSGNLVARYIMGLEVDQPLAEVRGSTTSFYQADGLGSVTTLTDVNGALANTYTYDSFGNRTASTGSFVNPFGYTARELDSETGLILYRARYYDSTSGRFLSEDPIRLVSGTVNFYAYADNDPVNETDPSGLTTQVCCRPLHGALGKVSGKNHCYVLITSEDDQLQWHTYGLHREDESNVKFPDGAKPRMDDKTDAGGTCAYVTDAKPCKERQFAEQAMARTKCPSCGKDWPRGNYEFWSTNSNYWVWNALTEAGMTPPVFPAGNDAPGYGPLPPPPSHEPHVIK